MTAWHVSLTLNAPITPDDADTLIGALSTRGAAIALGEGTTTFSLTANGDSIPGAFHDALTAIKAAACHIDAIADSATGPVAVTVETFDHLDDDLARPVFPEVVGFAEIADMAGVSRQAARQYSMTSTFPRPVIETAQGPLMARAAVQDWLDTRAAQRAAV